MTMPHLMNCSHSEDSWCLSCVKELWLEKDKLETELEKLKETKSSQRAEYVPEWFSKMLQEVWSTTKPPLLRLPEHWNKVEAEISRRMAEITAERDAALAAYHKTKEPVK